VEARRDRPRPQHPDPGPRRGPRGRQGGTPSGIALRRPLETYSHVDLQLYEGRNLDVINQAELLEPFAEVCADFALPACAATMAEAADRVAQEDERNVPVFLLRRAGLQALQAGPPEPSIFVDAYPLRLASATGLHVFTDACADCRRPGDHRTFPCPPRSAVPRLCAVRQPCTTPARR
jgi:recombinational DNA repair protein (RecF pathway)